MSSSAAATFTLKNIATSFPAADLDIGIVTVLRKKQGDATLSFAFSDASLKEPMRGQGMIISAEKPLGDGIKGSLSYDLDKHSAIGAMTLNKSLNGSDLQLRAVYKQAGDVFILEETWKFDANNKLAGAYNFSTEEAQFAYTYTKDDWSATGRYNIKKESSVLEVAKKQGKATVGMSYALKDEVASVTWVQKPFRAQLKAKFGTNGLAKDPIATFAVTHEFEI